jgi:hypothetical protein
MPLRDWFRSKGIPDGDADGQAGAYANAFTTAEIPNDEKQLPKLGLTRDDLRTLNVKAGHLQIILDGIADVERDGQSLADDRKDFIRRFVAVAVGVGFATRLVHMPWIDDINKLFERAQIEELVRLGTGIFVVVSGWEWYHRDLKDRPLNYPWRFYVDVAVVIYTIVFLYSSNNEGVWFFSLVAIFGLYVLWDSVSLIELRQASDVVRKSIWSGFVTNIIWLGFFMFLFFDRNNHPLATCLFVFLAAAVLRALGGLRVPPAITIGGLVVRFIIVGGLAALYHFVVPLF